MDIQKSMKDVKLQEMIVEANLSLVELLQFFHLIPRRIIPSSVQNCAVLMEGCILMKMKAAL